MTTIEEGFSTYKNKPSNIHEHMSVLAEYAEKCTSVVELGVSEMITTWAFMKGLRFNKKKKKHITCVDILKQPENFTAMKQLGEKNGLTIDFVLGNSTQVELPKRDLLFIDTCHFYGLLKDELEKHHALTKKYIIMHNTEIDGKYGEVIRMCYYFDVDKIQQVYGNYSMDDVCKGTNAAIEEFLANHSEWALDVHLTNNNGLTVLKKKESVEQ